MTQNGKDFENLVYEIYDILLKTREYDTVEMDVALDGPEGPRQIDVLIRSEIAGMPILTVIECKDHSRKLNVTFVDALASKMFDVNANKGVLIAREGFSNGAIKKARRLGITMCVANDAKDKLKEVGFDLPVIGHHVEPVEPILISFEFGDGQNNGSIRVDANSLFNGMGLMEILEKAIASGVYDFVDGSIDMTKVIKNECVWICDPNGKKVILKRVSIKVPVNEKFYFGYISDVASAKYLVDITSGRDNIVLSLRGFEGYRRKLKEFSHENDIPKFAHNTAIKVFSLPDRIEKVGEMRLLAYEEGNPKPIFTA